MHLIYAYFNVSFICTQNHDLVMKLFDERDKNKEVGEKAMRRVSRQSFVAVMDML